MHWSYEDPYFQRDTFSEWGWPVVHPLASMQVVRSPLCLASTTFMLSMVVLELQLKTVDIKRKMIEAINNVMAWLKVTRTPPYVCGKVLEQSYIHTTSCFPSLSLMNLQMQGLMILRQHWPSDPDHDITILKFKDEILLTTAGRTLQHCRVCPGGEPPLWWTSSGNQWMMGFHRSCSLESLTRSAP